jgi:hypothetical protein
MLSGTYKNGKGFLNKPVGDMATTASNNEQNNCSQKLILSCEPQSQTALCLTHGHIMLLLGNTLTSAFCTFAALIISKQVLMLLFLSDFAVIWQMAITFLGCNDTILLKLLFTGQLFAAQN